MSEWTNEEWTNDNSLGDCWGSAFACADDRELRAVPYHYSLPHNHTAADDYTHPNRHTDRYR